MSTSPKTWPEANNKILLHQLNDIADQFPDFTYGEFFSDPTNLAAGYRKVTYREFANAVHATAWWIENNVGRPDKDDGSVALVYIGQSDLRYGFLILAAVCVGYRVCLFQLRVQKGRC
jgi:hypothetical protein